MADYEENYVEYDELGLVTVRCMKCNTPVAVRTYKDIGKEKVMTMRRLSNWRQTRIEMDNGTYANPIICQDCEKTALDHEGLLRQVKSGWEIELRGTGKPESEIQDHVKKWEKVKIGKKEKVNVHRNL